MRPILNEFKRLKKIDVYFLTIAAAGVLLTLLASYDFSYTIFGDRLLLRASNIFNEAQTMGPELTYEGRVPGGVFYYIVGLLFLPFSSPLLLNSVLIGLHIFAGFYLYLHVFKYTNRTTACITAAFFFSQHLLVPEILYLWNPSLSPILGVLIFKGMTNVFIDGKKSSSAWLIPLIGIAAQTHLSFLTLAFTFIVLAIFHRKDTGLLYPSIGFILFFVTYSPYLYTEATSGLLNTSLLSKSALNVNDYKNIGHYIKDLAKHLPLFLGGIQSGWENRVPSGNFLNSIKYIFAIPTTLLVFSCASYYSLKKYTPTNSLVKLSSYIFLTSIIILIFTMTPIRSRRVLFLLPYVIVITSFALGSIIQKGSKLKKSLIVSLSVPFFMFHLSCFAYEIDINTRQLFKNSPSLFFSYRDFLEVVELAQTHGVTRSEMRYGVTFVDKDKEWLWTSFKNDSVYNVTRFAIDYLANWKYGTTASVATPLERCYFFTRNKYLSNHDLQNSHLNLKDFGFIDRSLGYIGSSFNFSLFTYKSWNGNCVRRVNNRYYPTEQEKLLSRLKHGLIKEAPPASAYSVIDIQRSTEISFLVTVRKADGDKKIIGLHSPELRGYDGPSRYWLESPILVLTHVKTNQVHRIEFFPSKVESKVRMHTYWDQYDSHNLMLTPFWSDELILEKGEYSVEVAAKSLRFGYFAFFGAGLIQPFNHRFKRLLQVD